MEVSIAASSFTANNDAPVFSTGHIDIDAGADIVWDVMTSVEAWPTWNPDVRHAVVHGPIAEGVRFEWKAGPGRIRSVFCRVDRPNVLGWTGKTLGIPAVHVYRLERLGDSTRVFLDESWDGFLARAFTGALQKTLDRAVATGLKALKSEAERRAAVT